MLIPGSLLKARPKNIDLSDGSIFHAEEEGLIDCTLSGQTGLFKKTLKRVLHAPQMHVHLLSVSSMQENGCSIKFRNNACEVARDTGGACVLNVPQVGRSLKVVSKESSTAFAAIDLLNNAHQRWHECLGHPSSSSLDALRQCSFLQVKMLGKSRDEQLNSCTACAEGKMPRSKFPERDKEIKA